MTANDIQILVSLLNRLPMSLAETAWAQDFILRLQATVHPQNAKKGEDNDNG